MHFLSYQEFAQVTLPKLKSRYARKFAEVEVCTLFEGSKRIADVARFLGLKESRVECAAVYASACT